MSFPAHTHRKACQMQDAVRTLVGTITTQISVTGCVSICLIRDNLEFLQWMKRFWDSNFGGQGYDAVARRRGAPTDTPATIAPLSSSRTGSATAGLGIGGRSGGKTPISGHRAGSTQPNEAMQALQAQLREMTTHLEGLEKERDFYFAKVRQTVFIIVFYFRSSGSPAARHRNLGPAADGGPRGSRDGGRNPERNTENSILD